MTLLVLTILAPILQYLVFLLYSQLRVLFVMKLSTSFSKSRVLGPNLQSSIGPRFNQSVWCPVKTRLWISTLDHRTLYLAASLVSKSTLAVIWALAQLKQEVPRVPTSLWPWYTHPLSAHSFAPGAPSNASAMADLHKLTCTLHLNSEVSNITGAVNYQEKQYWGHLGHFPLVFF